MFKEFTYRELSEKLNINFHKLKRWGREFLPPDPSAGQSQGVARVLTFDDAFTIFIGGHLVSQLKYGIPEARIILELLLPWLKEQKLIPSVFEICFLKSETWVAYIYFDEKKNNFYIYGESTGSFEYYKQYALHFDSFSIFRRRVKEHKIQEIVTKYQGSRFIDPPDSGTPKLLQVTAVCLSFYHQTIGKEFDDKYADYPAMQTRPFVYYYDER
jgi:hypothetical protein